MLVGDVRWATTGSGVLLEVVGRQVVVLGADEGLEEPPRASARRTPQRSRTSSLERSRRTDRGGGMLTTRATTG